MGAAGRRDRALRQGRARALRRAARLAGGDRVAVARRSRAGSGASAPPSSTARGAFVLETIAGELPEELAAVAQERGGRLWVPFSAASGRGAARAQGLAHGPPRAALRRPAAGRPGARAGHALAGGERRGAALHARRQLGPGDGPGLPRPARGRGARPLAARRPLPARAAGALPAPLRRRGRARRRRRARAPARRARRGRGGRARLARAPGAGARRRGRARRRAAAVPARRRRLRAEGPRRRSWPTSRAWARRCRRSPRWRRTAPIRPSSSARRASSSTGSARPSAGSRTAPSPSCPAPGRSRRPPR